MTRDGVLGAVRAALASRGPALEEWTPPRETIADPVERFVRELEAASGDVVAAASAADGIRRVSSVAGVSRILSAFDVEGLERVDAETAWQDPGGVLGIAEADHGIAASGTCVFEAETDLDLLTEHAVVLLRRERIVRDLWDLPTMPRDRVMVTGPSRTADIEKKLVLGAHGPRRLTVVLLG